ncbi:MAG: nucleotidyltransferase family protein [Acidobacteriia bacterium]|nr:nucleotidyltransferase family protein [Terriglobia bacterium]MBV8907068.1 nucleotidyltransferase family protein [Terriglobia bacterium]
MSIANIDIVILAGGLGTRLREVLPERPKILAPIGGQPFLDHLLRWLIRQGARKLVLGLGYRAADVLTYLETHSFAPLEIHALVEPEPLGTGGAVSFALPSLRSDPILVINGDTIIEADLGAFLRAYLDSGAEASILCAVVEDPGRYGRIEMDALGRVFRFAEKDSAQSSGPAWINGGVYLFGQVVKQKIAALKKGSLERDILEKMPPGSVAAFRASGRFLDIGTPETLALAPEVLAQ